MHRLNRMIPEGSYDTEDGVIGLCCCMYTGWCIKSKTTVIFARIEHIVGALSKFKGLGYCIKFNPLCDSYASNHILGLVTRRSVYALRNHSISTFYLNENTMKFTKGEWNYINSPSGTISDTRHGILRNAKRSILSLKIVTNS